MHSAETEVLHVVRRGLHDLAQPLTAMQCRLWLGQHDTTPGASAEQTLQEALEVCETMIVRLRGMQEQVESMLAGERAR